VKSEHDMDEAKEAEHARRSLALAAGVWLTIGVVTIVLLSASIDPPWPRWLVGGSFFVAGCWAQWKSLP